MTTLFSLPFANRRTLQRVAAALTLACAALITVPAMAASPHLRIASSEIGRTQYIEVGVNKSVIVDLPVEAGEVIVSQPGVANAIMRTRSRAIIQGMAPGETNIFFLDPAGAGIAVIEISVAQDSTGLAATINRLIPGARVSVESLADSVVLSGNVNSGADLEKAIEIASQYVGGGGVTSVIEVAGGQQIALKVTVAEIQRETARQLGIDLSASVAMSSSQIGLAGPASSVGSGAGNYSFGLSVPNVEIEAALRALESQNAVKLLAEPVLTAMSGQEATFHVGGEFPVETRDSEGNIILVYKPYGIQLAFTPTVESNGQVGLVLDTEVSEPQLDNTLNVRSATTSVELGTNQTLAIAGLIDERMRRQLSSLPGLGNIPILGALFRSYEYVSEQTELVILVTPMIAQPTPSYARAPLPTDTYQPASDAESMFLGRMESLYGVTGGGGAGEFRGSVGFVLD